MTVNEFMHSETAKSLKNKPFWADVYKNVPDHDLVTRFYFYAAQLCRFGLFYMDALYKSDPKLTSDLLNSTDKTEDWNKFTSMLLKKYYSEVS